MNDFGSFLKTLPTNLQDTTDYNMKRYWELNGRPISFKESGNMFDLNEDGYYHANSVAYNKDDDTYEFMKSISHPTITKELEWYNSPDSKEFKNEGYRLTKKAGCNAYEYSNLKYPVKQDININKFMTPSILKNGGLLKTEILKKL